MKGPQSGYEKTVMVQKAHLLSPKTTPKAVTGGRIEWTHEWLIARLSNGL